MCQIIYARKIAMVPYGTHNRNTRMNEMLPKIIVVVGPTASGKSSLAVELARAFDGEVISADSRQVYRGLDLSSGKITTSEMRSIPHHLLDIADPRTTYTAADFVRDGRAAIEDILGRHKLPIVAGGTFFYIDALLGRATLPNVPPDPALRTKLETHDTEELNALLRELDSSRADTVDPHNRRRIIRAIEIARARGTVPQAQPHAQYHALTIGIAVPRDELHRAIHERIDARIRLGMIEEIRKLHEQSLSWERLDTLGLEYRYIAQYLQGTLAKAEMISVLAKEIQNFAKRQLTWLRRDSTIKWFAKDDVASITQTVAAFVAR